MNVGPVSSSFFPEFITEGVESIQNFCESTSDSFSDFFTWATSWISSAFSSSEPTPYELSPEQKRKIEEIYYESLKAINELDHPEHKEEVRSFLKLLRDYYAKRTEQLQTQARSQYDQYEFSRKQVQIHQEDERAEFEKMIRDAGASNIWQRLSKTITPIYIMVASFSLTPALNAAVFCAGLVLALETASDHAISRKIAEMLAKDDREYQDLLDTRFQQATSIIGLGIALPLTLTSFPLAVAFAFAKGTAEVGGIATQLQKGKRESRLTQINHDAKSWGERLNDSIKYIKETNDAEQRLNREVHEILEVQNHVSDMVARGA